MPEAPRVVMLASSARTTRMVFHHLDGEVDVVGVILEDRVSPVKMFRRRARRLGWRPVLGQLAFRVVVQEALGRLGAARQEEILRDSGYRDDPLPEDRVRRVASINGKDVPALLEAWRPDVIVVNGTRIIGRRLLERFAETPFVNTHLGITPAYRGVHGGYWALARQEADAFGATIHLVDRGIDTGGVLHQATAQPTERDHFGTYPLLQLCAVLPAMPAVVRRVAAGDRTTLDRSDRESRLYYHPTLGQYLHARWMYGVR